jgi:dihydroflavonol-4-reductase
MRALVTGGTGFVGSNLVAALLDRGIEVRVLRRSTSPMAALEGLDCETRVGDVLDGVEALTAAMADCDWVFHTAAVSDYWRHRTQAKLYRTNVDGTRDMAEAARRAGIKRFVYTSSIAALGIPPRGRELVETDEFNIRPRRFPYGHSKHLAETVLRDAVAAGLPAVIVNPSVVIGPRDVNRIASAMIVEAQRGRIGERYILGGENLLFGEAFAIANEVTGQRGPSIVLPRWTIPVAAASISLARAVVGPRLPIGAHQMRLSAAEIFADSTKAREELRLPFTSFRTALRDAYHWYRDNGYLAR